MYAGRYGQGHASAERQAPTATCLSPDASPQGTTSWDDLPQHLQMLLLASAAAPLSTCRAAAAIKREPQLLYTWLVTAGTQVPYPLTAAAKLQQWQTCFLILNSRCSLSREDASAALVVAMHAQPTSDSDTQAQLQLVHQLVHKYWSVLAGKPKGGARQQAAPVVSAQEASCKDLDAPCQCGISFHALSDAWHSSAQGSSSTGAHPLRSTQCNLFSICHATRDPLAAAAMTGNVPIVQYLLRHYTPQPQSKGLDKAAKLAVKHDHPAVLQLLLQHGVQGSDINSLLTYAIRHNRASSVQLLLQFSNTSASPSCLLQAVQCSSLASTQLLLQHGVEDTSGWALLEASVLGNPRMLQLLVEAAAAQGVACLASQQVHTAAAAGAADIISHLLNALELSMQPLPEPKLSQLLLTAISGWGMPELQQEIHNLGCLTSQCQAMLRDVEQRRFRSAGCAEVLLSHGADLNAQQGGPLLAAVLCDNMPALRHLLSRGAEVNAGGGAALCAAIELGKTEAAAALVAAGATEDPISAPQLLRLHNAAASLLPALEACNLAGGNNDI